MLIVIINALINVEICSFVVIYKRSVIVESNFNSIELTYSILILELGKFPSLIEWDERRMRIKCSTRFT